MDSLCLFYVIAHRNAHRRISMRTFMQISIGRTHSYGIMRPIKYGQESNKD
jgi:hypothetical protein